MRIETKNKKKKKCKFRYIHIFTQDNPWKLESLFPMGSCIMHGCFALGGHYCGRKPEHPEKTHVSKWATNHTLSHTTTADHGDWTRVALVRNQCATTVLYIYSILLPNLWNKRLWLMPMTVSAWEGKTTVEQWINGAILKFIALK